MNKNCADSGKSANACHETGKKLRVVNIGLQNFYDALIYQNIKAVQITWRPPVKQSEEIADLLNQLL